MFKELPMSSLRFLRFKRYEERRATMKIRQIEHLLFKSQVPVWMTPLLVSAVLRPVEAMLAIKEYDKMQHKTTEVKGDTPCLKMN